MSRRPELLLLLTTPAFLVQVAVAVATVRSRVDSTSGELTAADVSALGAGWMLVHLLWVTPSVLAVVGLTGLARRLGAPDGALVTLQVVTLSLAAAYLVVQVAAYDLGTATWGDSVWYAAGVGLSLATGWFGTIPATVLVARHLVRRRTAVRAARTVVLLLGVYLVWEVSTYAAIALGPRTLLDTVGPPPVLLGVVWGLLGGSLWLSAGRRRGAA